MNNLSDLHELCLKIEPCDFQEKLEQLAKTFLGTSYGAWKNGATFETLDDFNFDLNLLDCITFVEVVMALAKTNPNTNYSCFEKDFAYILRSIHYKEGVPNFINSNHFTCIDWITNNKNIFDDMTCSLSKAFKLARTEINRKMWFKKHRVNTLSDEEFDSCIAPKLTNQISTLPYIETEELLDNYVDYLNKFPPYCIVNIVRPNWQTADRIGSNLNISHLGVCIKNSQKLELNFYHATVIQKYVVVQSLSEYLYAHLQSPTIRGINVLAISPGYLYARK